MNKSAHIISNFIPEDYEAVAYLDNKVPTFTEFFTPGADVQIASEIYEAQLAQYHENFARYYGWRHEGKQARVPRKCDHCGSGLRYVVVAKHIPTGNHICMGETCSERCEMTLEEHQLKNIKDVAAQRRETVKLGGRYNKLLQENPELKEAFERWVESGLSNGFIDDIKFKANQYGNLSEPQVEGVIKAINNQIKWAAERAEKRAQDDAEAANAPDITDGRQVIKGEVLTTKWQEGFYGDTLKMLVKAENGQKFWGTVPSAIDVERGDSVEFTATVERSDKDPKFGFYKRPAKASVTSHKAEEAA